MSYDTPGRQRRAPAPLDPALFEQPEMRVALAAHDVAAVYRGLTERGISQHQIARRTGQSQSEVCEILKGRKVGMYAVLVRICEGLGIPREYVGVSFGTGGAYAGGGTVTNPPEGGDEGVERRTVVGSLSLAVFGTPFLRFGEQLAQLGLPPDAPLPTRLTRSHVHTVAAATDWLRGRARQSGGMADEFGDAVRRYTRWLAVPGDDAVKAALGSALSELHTEAGWCGYDSGLHGLGYFPRAVDLANEFGDGYGVANAAWHAGMVLLMSGHPDDALKCIQLGQFQLDGAPLPGKSKPATLRADDPRVPVLAARLTAQRARAHAAMDDSAQARNYLGTARDNWQRPGAFERAGIDLTTAGIYGDLGRIEAAEPFAQSAVRTYGDDHHRGRVIANTRLAALHVRAGEPRGLTMAATAIDGVSTLHSVPARNYWLSPLVAALDARPGSDARDLARKARHVAAAQV